MQSMELDQNGKKNLTDMFFFWSLLELEKVVT